MYQSDIQKFRIIGSKLAVYLRGRDCALPEIPVLEALVADFASVNDELVLPLKVMISKRSFCELVPLAGSGSGETKRDILLQELRSVFSAETIYKLEAVLNGFLDVESPKTSAAKNRFLKPPSTSGYVRRANDNDAKNTPIALRRIVNLHHFIFDQQFHPGRSLVNANPQKISAPSPVVSLVLAFAGCSLTVFLVSNWLLYSHLPVKPKRSIGVPSRTSDEPLRGEKAVTIIEGKVGYPGEGIPPLNICAVDVDTDQEYCKAYPGSQSIYTYQLKVPSGVYYVFYSKWSDFRKYKYRTWSGDSTWSPDGGKTSVCSVTKYFAEPGAERLLNADIGAGFGASYCWEPHNDWNKIKFE